MILYDLMWALVNSYKLKLSKVISCDLMWFFVISCDLWSISHYILWSHVILCDLLWSLVICCNSCDLLWSLWSHKLSWDLTVTHGISYDLSQSVRKWILERLLWLSEMEIRWVDCSVGSSVATRYNTSGRASVDHRSINQIR